MNVSDRTFPVSLSMFDYLFPKRIMKNEFDAGQVNMMRGGGGGIRTLDGVAPITIFETVPFNRSGTPPKRRIV